MNLIKRIEELTPEFIAIRRDFHRYPEVGHQENVTAEKIANYLRQWGYQVHTKIAGTGVVALLKCGDSSKCLSIRADMDALPIEEANCFAHASVNKGVMHACGHDGHMTMALLAARYLAETQHFNGTVQFVFQPCEEQDGGASDMISDGLFKRFPTDCIIACHNWPDVPQGKIALNWQTIMASCNAFRILVRIALNWQTIMASCNAFRILVRGRGAHGAMPNNGIDPLFVAVQITNSLQGIITRIKRPIDPAVLSICKITAGETYNVIADTAEIEGTVRTFSEDVTDLIADHMKKIASHVASAFGATAEVNFIRQVPPVTNNPEWINQVQNAAIEVVGQEAVLTQEPVMPSEDFGVFLKHCPGALFFIGNGEGKHRQEGHGPGPCSLHNPSYDFNDSILPLGASIFARIAENYLS